MSWEATVASVQVFGFSKVQNGLSVLIRTTYTSFHIDAKRTQIGTKPTIPTRKYCLITGGADFPPYEQKILFANDVVPRERT